MTHSVPHRPDSGYATRPVTDLHLNFLPLLLSERVFMGGTLPFESPDQLRLLRNQYNSTHVLRRQGYQIACVPLVADGPSLGVATTFEVAASWSLVRRLVQDALIRSLVAWGLQLTGFDPPAFVDRDHAGELHGLLGAWSSGHLAFQIGSTSSAASAANLCAIPGSSGPTRSSKAF